MKVQENREATAQLNNDVMTIMEGAYIMIIVYNIPAYYLIHHSRRKNYYGKQNKKGKDIENKIRKTFPGGS